MSHFSKIKTNITNVNILIKTIQNLGFNYRFVSNLDNHSCKNDQYIPDNLLVYKKNQHNTESSIFTFVWNNTEYVLLVDLDSWCLDVSFNHLFDRLFQQYAYNIVISTGRISGFHKIKQQSIDDGSIKLTLQRWNSD
uniref:Ycf35 n=1 Tax=Aphanocladia delicatula TaxID=3041656 RepID=UPI002551FBD1|nr:Ycf35 [Aphanocladia delicatula]WGH14206.1 Ycf35 [Aphanocladia delicatula]